MRCTPATRPPRSSRGTMPALPADSPPSVRRSLSAMRADSRRSSPTESPPAASKPAREPAEMPYFIGPVPVVLLAGILVVALLLWFFRDRSYPGPRLYGG